MNERHRLPNRSSAETFTIEAFGLNFSATVGRGPSDDRVMEVFLSNHKPSSAAGIMALDAAVAASLALLPDDVLRKAIMRDSRGRAAGPLGQALDQIADDQAQQPAA
jgi:hypothetical protein